MRRLLDWIQGHELAHALVLAALLFATYVLYYAGVFSRRFSAVVMALILLDCVLYVVTEHIGGGE